MFRHSYTLQIKGSQLGYYHVVYFDSSNEVPTVKEFLHHLKLSSACYQDEYAYKADLLLRSEYHFVTHVYFLIVD